MPNYKIVATITKITSDGNVAINGVGKHRYEKSKDEVYNLLEECSSSDKDDSTKQSPTIKLFKQDVFYSNAKRNAIITNLLAMAVLNKKPLKLTIEETEIKKEDSGQKGKKIKKDEKDYRYSITEVEVP